MSLLLALLLSLSISSSQTSPCVVDADCDDGNVCTRDFCSGGTCEAATLTCEDGPRDCEDDGNPCTYDRCGLQGECVHLRKVPGTPCPDDGLFNTMDTCRCTGACEHWTADLTEDGLVNAEDLASLLEHWGPISNSNWFADFDGDRTVGSADLAFLLMTWSQ
jgi:hypothetical protein